MRSSGGRTRSTAGLRQREGLRPTAFPTSSLLFALPVCGYDIADTKREDTMDHAITRRMALGTAALGVAALANTPAQAGPRKTFVLVHGAWHGGWCWRRVADILEKHGHKVYAQALTGNGDRAHLLSKDMELDTPIADIVNLVTWEDLRDVCLVAHSYGGWPSSAALEHIHDRVGSIVWLDAFKPEDGQKGTDFASEFSRKAMMEAVAKGEPGRKGPPA